MKKILLIFGGVSSEHFISCKSAKAILKNIDKNKFEMHSAGIDQNGNWFLFDQDLEYLDHSDWASFVSNQPIENPVSFLKQFDAVFPITHGKFGEDGKLQGFLDLFHIPYVGCDTLSSAIGMDKGVMKDLASLYKIPQVPYLIFRKEDAISNIYEHLSFPLIIKPSNGGSSIGIQKATCKQELENALTSAFQFDSTLVIEEFITCRELECGILEKEEVITSDVGEIISANEFYDYNAKYENTESKVQIPAQISETVRKKIQEYSTKIFQLIHGNGFARVDFFYDELKDQIYFNEINTLPGFTSISMYPMLWKEKGISFQELLTFLIESADKKKKN